MAEEGSDPPDKESKREERDRHWRELMERRHKRDEELKRLEKEGLLAPSMVGDDANDGEDGPKESVLEKMRYREGGGLSDVDKKEMAAKARSAKRRQRGARGLALVGLLVVCGLVAFVVLGSKGNYQVTADFTNASQIVGGEVVTLGGTPVGKVTKIELADDGDALITFSVNDDFAPLKSGTTAQIRSFSLSGVANRQIELTLPPEGTDTETIASGGTIDKSDTISEVDLDEIFNTLNPKTAADFKKVIKGFASTYQGKAATQANAGFKYLNPFLSTSRQTFAELTRDTPALEQLIVDGASLSHTLAAKRSDISSLVGNLDLMMNAIARQRTSLTSALQKLPDFMRNFNTTAVNLRAALDDVDPLVDASKPVAIRLKPFFANFRAAAHDLVPTVSDLDKVVEDPGRDNDLVDLTRLQPNLAKIAVGPVRANGKKRQGAFPEGATALTDSLDELAFFRAYTPELTGWFDDFGHSGLIDANGGIGRIGTTANTFSLGVNDLPVIDLAGALATTGTDLFDINNYQRCPGSNERPAPDGSNPFTDPTNPASAGGPVKCDPSIIPPGK